MPQTIRFCFDYVSPYAYLAWTQIGDLAKQHGSVVEPVPILFAALLDAHGTRGPAEVPARRRYLIKDVARKASALRVPIDAPFAHPFNPLLSLRLSSLPLPQTDRVRLVDALFRATWVERRDVTAPGAIREVLRRAEIDESLIDRASAEENKQRLKSQTQMAIQQGVFGVPSMLVGEELFWGTDSLADLGRFLSGASQVSGDLVARWEALPSAAQRPSASAR